MIRVWTAFLSSLVVTGCGVLVDPLGNLSSSSSSAGDSGASSIDCATTTSALCDTFDRTEPVPANDPRWASVTCASPGALAVDGQLEISVPAVQTDLECTLDSQAVGPSGSYALDFDVTATFDSASSGVTLAGLSVSLANPLADGRQNAFYSLVVDGQGRSSIFATYYYPDVSKSPDPGNQYPGYELGEYTGSWLLSGTRCHVHFTVDTATPSSSAEATCGSQHAATQASSPSGPAGFSTGDAHLGIGYQQANVIAVPAWKLSFDNVLLIRQ